MYNLFVCWKTIKHFLFFTEDTPLYFLCEGLVSYTLYLIFNLSVFVYILCISSLTVYFLPSPVLAPITSVALAPMSNLRGRETKATYYSVDTVCY